MPTDWRDSNNNFSADDGANDDDASYHDGEDEPLNRQNQQQPPLPTPT
jgi:hypothetical protein